MNKISLLNNVASLFTQNDLFGGDEDVSITGLIITAGLSSRMGNFKPLLQYKGKSFLHNIIDKLNPICDNIVIVTGHNKKSIEAELKDQSHQHKTKTIYNQNYQDGMFTSLQTGLKFVRNSNWVLYHFIDQPGIPTSFYSQIVSEIDKNFDWIQPKYDGKKGHPILLGEKAVETILSSKTTSNLKNVSELNNFKKKFVEVNTQSILFDADTKSDYKYLTNLAKK